jgi:hypothetical protein
VYNAPRGISGGRSYRPSPVSLDALLGKRFDNETPMHHGTEAATTPEALAELPQRYAMLQ